MFVRYKQFYDALELCDLAAKMVKAAGFVFHQRSLATEACYYCWPGRSGLLRIAAHKKKKTPIGLIGPTVAKITFYPNGCAGWPGMVKISDARLEAMVAEAIGRYFMKSSAAKEQDT